MLKKNNKISLTIIDIAKMLFPWWFSDEKNLARICLFLLMALSLVSVYLSYAMNAWSRDFYQKIEDKNLRGFLYESVVAIPILGAIIVEGTIRRYLINFTSFRWRRWMTKKTSQDWLRSKTYYLGYIVEKDTSVVDNPDQRISQDIDTICYLSMDLFLDLFRDSINFITFSIVLWGISRGFILEIWGQNIVFDGFLVFIAVSYSLTGIFLTFKIGKPLIALGYNQEKLEANFRFRLMRIREWREEIAKHNAEEYENKGLSTAFAGITRNYYKILRARVSLNLFQNLYLNSNFFVPLLVASPQYFIGIISFGVLMQIQGLFTRIDNSLSTLVTSYTTIASIMSSMQRLYLFQNSINITGEQSKNLKKKISCKRENIKIENLKIHSPEGLFISQIENFKMTKGEKKLILAQSGKGKSHLFKILCGIYPFFKGRVSLPVKKIMMLPQRTYIPQGTLMDVLCFPSNKIFDKKTVVNLMKEFEIGHLINKLDSNENFQTVLSLGEQQKVNFIRAILHSPEWLLIDEPGSNLSKESSDKAISLIFQKLQNTGILIISHNQYSSVNFDEIHKIAI